MPRDFTRACKLQTSLNSRQKEECKLVTKQIRTILSKDVDERTDEEETLLKQYKPIVRLVESQRQYQLLKATRQLEVEDSAEILEKKIAQLAQLMRSSRHTVVYTGAGISTSASIPDYRGPKGVWTQLKARGASAPVAVDDLVFAEPTFTHMAIAELVRRDLVAHVVSQNCDGLHLRSGLREDRLSEIHGNMFVEVCRRCDAHYLRSFDVTEKTALRRHDTGRFCGSCGPDGAPLIDTIVHFGEKGKLKYPLKWEAAAEAASKAELIIAIGSSLKVLRRYQCLWPLTSSTSKRKPSLAIINLQWTPKDSQATLKLNGRCDQIIERLVAALRVESVPQYVRTADPVVRRAVPLRAEEETTCHRTKLEEVMAIKEQNENSSSSSVSTSVDKKLTPGWFGVGLKKK